MFGVGEDVIEWPDDAVEVGRVIGAWGIKGAIKVHPHAADPQGLFSSKRWWLKAPDRLPLTPAVQPGLAWPRLLRISTCRQQGDEVVAVVQDLQDRDLAQSLAGAAVCIPRSSFPTPADDEFYWVDLIGLEVRNRADESLGQVVGLLETGPHCVLRLSSVDAQGAPRMVPFVSAYVDRVDLPGRVVHVDWGSDY
jgi:16S rRNA processing protein RimM